MKVGRKIKKGRRKLGSKPKQPRARVKAKIDIEVEGGELFAALAVGRLVCVCGSERPFCSAALRDADDLRTHAK
jgi:hypothetical protein